VTAILQSIGDGVIATMPGCASLHEPRCRGADGWPTAEPPARTGSGLRIVNEASRDPLKNPCVKALQETDAPNCPTTPSCLRRTAERFPSTIVPRDR